MVLKSLEEIELATRHLCYPSLPQEFIRLDRAISKAFKATQKLEQAKPKLIKELHRSQQDIHTQNTRLDYEEAKKQSFSLLCLILDELFRYDLVTISDYRHESRYRETIEKFDSLLNYFTELFQENFAGPELKKDVELAIGDFGKDRSGEREGLQDWETCLRSTEHYWDQTLNSSPLP